MRNQRGITLVAIIVTVIVMIILAGVSINLAINEDGILKHSEKAVEDTELAEEKEFILETWSYVLSKCEDITIITPKVNVSSTDDTTIDDFLNKEKKIYSTASSIFSKYISNYGVGVLESVIGSYKENPDDTKTKTVNRVIFQLKGTEEERTFYIVNDTTIYEKEEFFSLYPHIKDISFRNIGTK